MKINLGSSAVRFPGFTNVDIVTGPGVDVIGSATGIPVESSSVDVLYFNAVLEHLFTAHVDRAFAEFNRVLKPSGVLIGLGIPDFHQIASLYLANAAGIVGNRFDIFNVYRYSHGNPEAGSEGANWKDWNPATNPYCAPQGYMGQLHKTLFDKNLLSIYLHRNNFRAALFNYCFRQEEHPVNLGFIASRQQNPGGLQVTLIRQTIATHVPGAEETIGNVVPIRQDEIHPDLMLSIR